MKLILNYRCYCLLILGLFVAHSGFSQSVSVSGALTGNGSYATLGTAFAAINLGSQTDAFISITVNADTDEGTESAVLYAGTWTSLTLFPDGNRTISGATAAGFPLIDLDGANRVTIEGLNSGGNALTIINTTISATPATATLRFINDASNNSIQNCTIKGSGTGAPYTGDMATANVLFSTALTTGNDNNHILNCEITANGSAFPSQLIASYGSNLMENDTNEIANNKLYDYFGTTGMAAINLASNSASWTISGNKLYQTVNHTTLGSAYFSKAIVVNTGSGGGYLIDSNTIGFNSALGTTVMTNSGGRFMGIELTSVAAFPISSVQGNTINGINWTTASNASGFGNAVFNGIYVGAGAVNIGTTSGNRIGNSSGVGAASNGIYITTTVSGAGIFPIYLSSASPCAISNNGIGALATGGGATMAYVFTGITLAGSGNHTLSANTIGNGTSGSIALGIAGATTVASAIKGIETAVNGETTTLNILANTITTISGIGAITGIYVSGSGTALAINGNTISKLASTGIGGNVTALIANNNAFDVAINGNSINTLSSTGISSTVSGIQIAGGIANVYDNTISALSETGTAAPIINGIDVSAGTTVSVYRNKIYNLALNGATAAGVLNGVLLRGGTAVVAHTNLIGDLKATAATNGLAIRGISVNSSTPNSSYALYYNTVVINATSSGTNFGTTGIYHLISTTATTAKLDLKNNLISNKSTPKGTGKTIAYYRSGTSFSNYEVGSGSNLFYAGTPASTKLIFYNGVNSDQTLAAFQTRVSPRENNSVTENTPFTSTNGADAGFLHITSGTVSFAESNGMPISGITTDADSENRNSVTPDIGADEFIGAGPSITNFTPVDFCSSQGISVTIIGVNLNLVTSVTFQGDSGSLTGTINSQTATSINVTTPAGVVGGVITLVYSGGSATSAPYTVLLGGSVSSDQAICSGAQPADLVLTGYTGTVVKWQSAPDASFALPTDIDISAATLSGADIGLISSTTYFRAGVQKGSCPIVYSSNYATITMSSSVSWTGASSTSWSNAGNWSCGVVPSGVIDVTIPVVANQPVISSDAFAQSLTLATGAILTIVSNRDLTVTDAIINDGTLLLQNNANLIQVNEAVNSGSGTTVVYKNSPALMRLDYVLWSAPVDGQQLQAFSPLTLPNRIYSYNSATDQYNMVPAPASTSFASARGYLIRMPDNHPGTATVWNGTFTGNPHNGQIDLAVTPGTYNAIGNPYPSSINADQFISINNLDEALYFWRKTNNSENPSYATYTLAGGIGTGNSGDPLGLTPDGFLQVGQGFIAKATTSALTFTNTMRTDTNTNPFLKNAQNKSRIWLNVTNGNGVFCQTLLAYMPAATSGVDAAIDGRFFSSGQTALTSIINNQEFAIQGKGLPFETNDVVVLGFKTNAAGSYTIAIDHFDGLFALGQEIILKDKLTNTFHDLSNGGYTFATEAGVFNSRFEIIYQIPLVVSQSEFNSEHVVVYKENQAITITTGKTLMSGIKVFDSRGRLLTERKGINSSTVTIADLRESNQLLLIQISAADHKIVVKKLGF